MHLQIKYTISTLRAPPHCTYTRPRHCVSVSASARHTAQNQNPQQGQVTNQQSIKTRSSMPILCACVVLAFIKIPPEPKAAGFVSTKLN